MDEEVECPCFSTYVRKFKRLLEKIERRPIPDSKIYSKPILDLIAVTYDYVRAAIKNCRENHQKCLVKYDCTNCLAHVYKNFLVFVAPWTKNLGMADLHLVTDFFYLVAFDIVGKCNVEACKIPKKYQ